jgi:hypothetical protein
MGAWGTSQDPTGKSGIRFLADPHGELTSALDLSFDSAAIFGNARSKRYALVVENGKVTQAHVEPDNTGLNGMVCILPKPDPHSQKSYKHFIWLTHKQSVPPRRSLEALESCKDAKISHFNEWSLDISVPYSLRSDQLYILKDLVHVKDKRKKAIAFQKPTKSPSHPEIRRPQHQFPARVHQSHSRNFTTTTALRRNIDKAKTKTYNRRDSQMVTHSSTSRPVQCLCMAERTGCPVITDLWSYVLIPSI